MNTSKIISLIKAYIGNWADKYGFPVEYANIEFTSTKEMYLQCHIIPAATDNIGLALDMKIYRGIVQVNIVTKAGNGEVEASFMSEQLCNLLKNGHEVVDGDFKVYFNGEPTVHPSIQDHVNYITPVSVPYRADVNR
ncbi:hypothetical protein Ppb6_01190 [Photorhabdus australis subsp. thailandensis]|uniref:Phage protein n=1 Tax=Photorhabdus australis subsp. thailandensis TaxID=2805096 RepID=A0A1C0U6K7_9GAMM|nr:phage tail terminator-like protein [Photorhabdus australis]OCQ53564.1 hypothetical protein Ppb6_01190 [Photorhabdus australis subsp. thailandensis]